MSRVFWRGQQAIALVGVVGGLVFWAGYGPVKGVEFAVALCAILEIPVIFEYCRRRRTGGRD
jgi:hypothetical protein